MSELDPQVAGFLKQVQAIMAQQPEPDHVLSLDEEIAAFRQFVVMGSGFGLPSEPVSKVEDLDIPGPAGKIPIRLYVPDGEKPFPALLYFHWGAFVAGDLESHDTLLRRLANRAQCIVVSVAYRLAPEHPYPAANDDAWAALSWIVDNAASIGIDPGRIAVGGESAGGLLAAWVAQKARINGPALRLQILLYACLDPTMSKASWKKFGSGAYIVSHAQMMQHYDAYLPQGVNREDPRVSPLFATDVAGLAPALIVTADHDPFHEEGDEYAAKLKEAGVVVDHTCLPGMVHGCASLAGVVDAGKALIDQTAAALRKAFQ